MKFTKQEIINIQSEQLEFWKSVLQPDIYEHLAKNITKDNDSFTDETALEIPRGMNIYEALQNIFNEDYLSKLSELCYNELIELRNHSIYNEHDYKGRNSSRLEYEIAMREKYSTLPTKKEFTLKELREEQEEAQAHFEKTGEYTWLGDVGYRIMKVTKQI